MVESFKQENKTRVELALFESQEKSKQQISKWVNAHKNELYTPVRNQKISKTKKGTKRQYLEDGTFIMVKSIDTNNVL